MTIAQKLSKAIKEAKWIKIKYENKDNDLTYYWISIKNIIIQSKMFICDFFNKIKITNSNIGIIKDGKIYFDKIKEATVLEYTTYERSEELLDFIDKNIKQLSWLEYDKYNDNILNYIRECIKYENIPYYKENDLIPGINEEIIEKAKINFINETKGIELDYIQIGKLIEAIEKKSYSKKELKELPELIINSLSISNNKKGLYIIAYRNLNFNPIYRSLNVSNELNINYEFFDDKILQKFRLRNYIDIEAEDFINLLINNKEQAKNLLMKELKSGEKIDDFPYVFSLIRKYDSYVNKELQNIKIKQKEKTMNYALKSFFNNPVAEEISLKEIIIQDDKLNIDQLRTIFNSMTKPITYVQGPPGTGKTKCIFSIAISSFFNKEKLLITSNNNKPITDIYNKLINQKDNYNKAIPFPAIRLGNTEEILKSLERAKILLESIKGLKPKDDLLENHVKKNKEKLKLLNDLLNNYEERLAIISKLDAIISFKKEIVDYSDNIRYLFINDEISNLEKKKEKLIDVSEKDIKDNITIVDKGFLNYLKFTSVKYLKRIYRKENQKLLEIIYSDSKNKVNEFNKYLSNDDNLKNFLNIFPIVLTTNQSVHRLGSQNTHFDLLVMDEAGQCSIGYSLFALTRATRLLLIGDQSQLKPVISIPEETNNFLKNKYIIDDTYDYLNSSILSTMRQNDSISPYILLKEHYRCNKDIINFSNKKYYNSKLIPMKNDINEKSLVFINSKEENDNEERNISSKEVVNIKEYLKNNSNKDIGIITPFKNQCEIIKRNLSDKIIDVGTVHSFQGDEKDEILLSLAVTKNTNPKAFDWLKNNEELINVAITRAKNRLVLFCDEEEINKRSKETNDLKELKDYVKQNGRNINITEKNTNSYINSVNYKEYNTQNEKDVFKAISHIVDTYGANRFIVKDKVKVNEILLNFTSRELRNYGFKAHFDLVIFNKFREKEIPILVVEVDGIEHETDEKVIKRDKKKEQICKDNNLKLVRIKNDYSRRYYYIKETIKFIFE